MPSFRILDQFPVYLDRLGVPLSGGSLRFYESGTDTPKDVFGDPALTVNNGDQVVLSSDGRTTVDVWGDGAYRVRLYAADGTLIAEADDVDLPGGAGTVIPPLEQGKVLSNDGSVLQWLELLQIPDPTGNAEKVLGTDGVNLFWQAVAENFQPDISGTSIKLGTILVQWGYDTVAPSNSYVANKAFSFPLPFVQTYQVFATVATSSGVGSSGGIPSIGVSEVGTTGAKAFIDMNGYSPISNPCPFAWLAIGRVNA